MQNYVWTAIRERDNFFYTNGATPICSLSCNNSLIISNSKNGSIESISNYALIQNKKKISLIPIVETETIIDHASKILKDRKIFYQKPKSISERENLETLSENQIKRTIFDSYGIEISNLFEIKNKKGPNRIYKLFSKEGEFILKYRGKDLNLFKAQASLLEDITYFPKIMSTINSNKYVFFKNHIYAIEEFIEGGELPLNEQDYFKRIGKHLALMHNEICSKKKNKDLEKSLIEEGNFLSESNFLSVRIDLMNNNPVLLKEMCSFPKDIGQKLGGLLNQFIHGDVNRSNLIWNGNNVKMIDSENVRFSKKVREFIPTLLFKGNFQNPAYVPNSAKILLNSYNRHSDNPLNNDEQSIILDILKFSLIKLYSIYNIRRNKNSIKFRNQIINDLEVIGGESLVY